MQFNQQESMQFNQQEETVKSTKGNSLTNKRKQFKQQEETV